MDCYNKVVIIKNNKIIGVSNMLNAQKLLKKLGSTRGYVGNPYDKLKIALDYISKNMTGTEVDDATINEIVFLTKKNIAETILHQAEENKIKINNGKLIKPSNGFDSELANKKLSMFMIAPETILKDEVDTMIAESNAAENYDPNETLDEEKNVEEGFHENRVALHDKKNYIKVSNLLKNKDASYSNYEAENYQLLNDKYNISANMLEVESENPIEDAIYGCKPGFFEKLFRTTSRQYTNFKNLLEQRMDGEASREDLKNAAKDYLVYKFPNFEKTGKLTDEQIQALSSSKTRDRVWLCYKTYKGLEKSENYEKKLDNIMNVSKENVASNNLTNELNEKRALNGNLEFQNNINNEMQNEFQNNLENNIQNNNEIVNEELNNNNEEVLIYESNEIQS